MHISNQKYKLTRLTEPYIEPAKSLLFEQFLKNNRTRAVTNDENKEEYRYINARVNEALEWEQELREHGFLSSNAFINFVYLNDQNEVVAVWVNVELTQNLNKKSAFTHETHLQLQKCCDMQEKEVNFKEVIPGRNLHSLYLAQSHKLNQIERHSFMIDGAHWLHSQGFRNVFTHCSNPKNLGFMLHDQAQVISKQKVLLEGKSTALLYIKWPMIPLQRRVRDLNILGASASL